MFYLGKKEKEMKRKKERKKRRKKERKEKEEGGEGVLTAGGTAAGERARGPRPGEKVERWFWC